jgi:ArsR family transcriptional regulator
LDLAERAERHYSNSSLTRTIESMTSISLESTPLETRAGVFAALSDPIRLQILDALSPEQRCVCDIQEHLDGVAANLLSYHLRVLREAGLVESTRRGRWIDYRLSPDADRIVGHALPPALGVEIHG